MEFFKKKGDNDCCKVKKKKVKRKDLENQISLIKEQKDLLANELYELTSRMSKINVATEDGRKEYDEINAILKDKHQLYDIVQKELDKEYQTLKSMNESGRTDTIIKGLMVGGEFVLCALTFMVNRENPAVMKAIDFFMKRLRPPMKF